MDHYFNKRRIQRPIGTNSVQLILIHIYGDVITLKATTASYDDHLLSFSLLCAASHTNLSFAVLMESAFKGSGAHEYLETLPLKNVLQFLPLSAHNQTPAIALPNLTTSLLNAMGYMIT